MDLHDVMDILNMSIGLLDPATVVNNVIVGLILLIIGGIGGFFVYHYKLETESKRIQKNELVCVQNKEKEHKHEIHRISNIILDEIEAAQNELKKLCDWRNIVDDKYHCISDDDKLPKKLNLSHAFYSTTLDKMTYLNTECLSKLSQYWHKSDCIKEQYETLEIMHNCDPAGIFVMKIDDLGRRDKILPEILEFLIDAEKIYADGEDLIKCLDNN